MNRNEMMDFALVRMVGFTLERSSYNDNRTIFSVVKMLIESAHGEKLEDCRKPLAAVLGIKTNSKNNSNKRDGKESDDKFLGCKLNLVQYTIGWIFGDLDNLLKAKEFIECDQRQLLEYLEICRRIFITKYIPTHPGVVKSTNDFIPKLSAVKSTKYTESKHESDLARQLRKWQEKHEGGAVK